MLKFKINSCLQAHSNAFIKPLCACLWVSVQTVWFFCSAFLKLFLRFLLLCVIFCLCVCSVYGRSAWIKLEINKWTAYARCQRQYQMTVDYSLLIRASLIPQETESYPPHQLDWQLKKWISCSSQLAVTCDKLFSDILSNCCLCDWLHSHAIFDDTFALSGPGWPRSTAGQRDVSDCRKAECYGPNLPEVVPQTYRGLLQYLTIPTHLISLVREKTFFSGRSTPLLNSICLAVVCLCDIISRPKVK